MNAASQQETTPSNENAWSVLLIEDDETVSTMVGEVLKRCGLKSISCCSIQETIETFQSGLKIGAVVVDLRLPDGNGLEVIRRVRQAIPELPFFILSANNTVESAVMAMKAGALDYFTKPFDPHKLSAAVSSAMTIFCSRQQGAFSIDSSQTGIRWKSQKMRQAMETARRAAQTRLPVLITGAFYTGKSEISRNIHQLGPNKNKPFITYNASSMRPEDLEARLFGQSTSLPETVTPHMLGRLQSDHEATISIENIELLRPKAQAKLLEWIRAEKHPGTYSSQKCRVIATSCADLPKMILDGTFREDLWFALAVHHIEVPSLSERQEDLPLLCEEIITKMCMIQKIKRPSFTRKAMEAILDHTWPGNIAELEHALSNSLAKTVDGLISKADLPSSRVIETPPATVLPLGITSIEELNKASLIAALQSCEGNRRRTANRLNVSLRTVYNMIKRYQLDVRVTD